MSDRVGLKTKENAAKKFSSLNLNQTYKGTKVEPKASTGIQRHGLQSLGKVATSRRMPPPANLPSLKSENLGNDPTVALVPSGGGGWGSGKPEKEASATTTTNKNASQVPPPAVHLQPQQPSKPTETSQKATTGQQTNTTQTTSTNQTSAATKSWASSSSSVAGGQERTSYPHQSQYFNQEFPTLGGGNSKDRLPEERASHQPYGQPPRNMHEPPWMDKGGTGPPPKPAFGMYNGAPYPGPPPQRGGYGQGPQMYNRDGHPMNNHLRPEGSENFPYMGQARPPNYASHPAATQSRGVPGPRIGGPMPQKHMIKLEDSPSGYVRPSVVNEDDIRAMDSEDVDEGGWAGAQEEIDYSVKLNFDDDDTTSGNDGQNAGGQNRATGPSREPLQQQQQQGDRVGNGGPNRTQVDGKRPNVPRQAWGALPDGHNNFPPQWGDPGKQGHYNAQPQGPYNNTQRPWSGHYPPQQQQQRNALPMRPQPHHPNAAGGRQPPQDPSRTVPTSDDKTNERIEHARQRKLAEEEDRKRQQEAAAREKLRLLDARTRPVHIQTHEASIQEQTEEEERKRQQEAAASREKLRLLDARTRPVHVQTYETSVREQAGPRSPVSPAGSDVPVRRIMRRKDSGSVGDDDGSSVKSVESVGKEEKKVVPENKNQIGKPRELRKTSSSDSREDRKSPALKKSDDERKAHETTRLDKDKVERKSSVSKDGKETPVEKPKHGRDSSHLESRHQKREEGKEAANVLAKVLEDRRDDKNQDINNIEDREKRPERKNSECRPRSDEASKKNRGQSETDKSRENNKSDYESRKENFEKRGNRLSSKNDRGSSESVRSRDSVEKRKDERRRPEDIKRKREDFERNEPLNEPGNRDRGANRDRFYSSRGRPTLGGKSHLRGHPKSYSHGRTDRTTAQRRNRTRNDSMENAEDEIKTVAPEEKGQANEKTEDRRWAGDKRDSDRRQSDDDRRQPGNDRRQPDGDRRQPGGDRRQPGGDRRQPDGDRRQPDGDRRQPDGDRRQPDGDRRQPEEDKPQPGGGDRRQTGDRRQPEGDRQRSDGDRRQPEDNRPQPGGGDRRRPDDDRRRPDDDRRRPDDDRRRPDGDRRQPGDRRPQQPNAEKRHRDGDRRQAGKRDPEEDQQQTVGRKDNQDSRFYNDKRNERGPKDDRSYKGSGRFPSRNGPTDRGERFRNKNINRGGFGVPPLKEQPKKNEHDEKSKNETREGSKTKPVSSTADSKVSESKDTISFDKEKVNEDGFVAPVSNDWGVSESRDTAKEAKIEDGPTQETATESKSEKPATKDSIVDNKEPKASTTSQAKSSQQVWKAERTLPNKDNREQENKASRNVFSDTKVDKRRESDSYGENRRKQDSKYDDRRTRPREEIRREQPKRIEERKPPVETSGDNFDHEQDSKQKGRKDAQEPRFEEKKKEHRDGSRQSERGDRPRDNASYRDRKDQRDHDKYEQRNRNERNRTEQQRPRTDRRDQGERTDRRTEQRDRIDRRERTEQQRERTRDGTTPLDRRHQTEVVNDKTLESTEDAGLKPFVKADGQKSIDCLPKKEGLSERTDKQADDFTTRKQSDRSNMDSINTGVDRRRFNESRRGVPSSRRGGRGGTRGMRGRGRGRLYGSGRLVGKGSTTSKDDDENDSEDYLSANSSVDSEESDSEEVFNKQDDRQREDKRGARSYSSGGRARQPYSSHGRGGRGGSQPPRSPRKPPEKPPRFQRQEQAKSASRGRGKSNRGGFSSKENWDENISMNKDSRASDEGLSSPLPKRRPPDSSFPNEKASDDSFRGRKTIRGGHSSNKSSFLAKKQQEAVEGSSRKGGARFGTKSTIPAALTTHGRNERRAKNEPAPADGDESLEPPKKNPRRTEPTKMGIEHIDMSNIAGFIDIDDIVQPASEFEPVSPQSGFVEVKSKRMQKEIREKAREEEERKRRETEKLIQDALMKPKIHKPTSQNKQHQTSKPPRFARTSVAQSNVVSTLPSGSTPPRGVSPETSSITALSSGNVEQKRTSPLMMEKPSSPPPPPMFNAWTKPLSITPAKPPNETSTELSRMMEPDPLAVGSGKPQRASGTHPKAEEPELQIQLTLPDTFQAIPGERDIDSQGTESRIFSGVRETENCEPNGGDDNDQLKKTNDENTEQTEDKKPDRPKAANKMNTLNVKTTESNVRNDKNFSVDSEKRQPAGNNWKSERPPRFEKNVPGKRNPDGRKPKADNKVINGERKPPPVIADTEKAPKEKNDGRPRTSSRPRDANKTLKAKPPVKTAKSQHADENRNQTSERNSQEKTENEEEKQNINKRDSVELDVQSMSESLLDETPLGVHMVETSKAGNGKSMIKTNPEEDLKINFEMHEKMVAAKKAWDHISVSSSVSMQTSQWTASVTDDENPEPSEVSVMDQIPRPTPEPEESSEPLGTVTTPRIKKPTAAGDQQNVCKVKPQQQQQPVKPQPVPTEVPEEYPNSNAIPTLESQVQAGYPVQPHQAAMFTTKPATQGGYTYSFEQEALVPINHQYVQTDMATIQQHHVSPVRPQTLHAVSQSPPQRAAIYPQGQSVSTPSPLSHRPLMHDTYRPLMQATALYSTNTFPGSQYFPISVVRPAAPPQFQTTINDDIGNSMYAVQAPKSQNPSHGYETAVPAGQQVFLPVEQQPYSDFVQPSQHPVGFYSGNTNQANIGRIPLQKSVAFLQNDKQQMQQTQHGRDTRTPSGRPEQQQVYNAPPGQSEMSKHVHAKPFQPPTSSPSGNAHQISPSVRQMPPASGQSTVPPAFHMNNAVLSMQVTGATASSVHTGTSPIVTQAHALPVSRLGFHQFPAVGSFQRQVQVPVQQLPPSTYPAGLTYRTPVPSYPTTTSVGNQAGVLVHKPTPMMRQLLSAGRGAPVPHRMPEPIQRPSKSGFHPGNLKEKQFSQQPRLKSGHQVPSRRAFQPVSAAQAQQMAAYQFQPLPQQPPQPQLQQMFRSQQHQQMLSNVQQFFAEDKEIERKQKQANQKREQTVVATTITSSDAPINPQQATEDKPQQKSKDEQKKRAPRTAQIPPRRNHETRGPQNRPKPGVPKKNIQQVSEAKKIDKVHF